MAERRMFAKSIVLSDAFLDMPLSARCLYFTLGMFADDDGFVGSPKGIMRQCGASQDDMLVLLQKRFVLSFDSGVIVIKHWRMNNYLQNDRHKTTSYIEELNTLEIDEKGAYTEKEGMYTNCIQNVYTGKDSIDKNSIGNINTAKKIDKSNEIIALYHEKCPSLPKVLKNTDARRKMVNARLKDYTEDEIAKAFEMAEESEFLRNGNGTWKGASFDWILNPNNIVKILEGNYKNKSTQPKNNQFNNFQQSNYDWDEINRELGIQS